MTRVRDDRRLGQDDSNANRRKDKKDLKYV